MRAGGRNGGNGSFAAAGLGGRRDGLLRHGLAGRVVGIGVQGRGYVPIPAASVVESVLKPLGVGRPALCLRYST